MKRRKEDWEKRMINSMIGLLIFFSALIVLFVILGISEWASVICAFMSVVVAVVLGTVSTMQNKRAGETNERLTKINQGQLEVSIINNNYCL